jgi:hypothetical protein
MVYTFLRCLMQILASISLCSTACAAACAPPLTPRLAYSAESKLRTWAPECDNSSDYLLGRDAHARWWKSSPAAPCSGQSAQFITKQQALALLRLALRTTRQYNLAPGPVGESTLRVSMSREWRGINAVGESTARGSMIVRTWRQPADQVHSRSTWCKIKQSGQLAASKRHQILLALST